MVCLTLLWAWEKHLVLQNCVSCYQNVAKLLTHHSIMWSDHAVESSQIFKSQCKLWTTFLGKKYHDSHLQENRGNHFDRFLCERAFFQQRVQAVRRKTKTACRNFQEIFCRPRIMHLLVATITQCVFKLLFQTSLLCIIIFLLLKNKWCCKIISRVQTYGVL